MKVLKIKTLKAKINNLQMKIPDTSTLVDINHYNTGKTKFEKKIEDIDKKYQIPVV